MKATMINTTPAPRRQTVPARDAFGMKAMIMVSSIAITLGGWVLLAASQAIEAHLAPTPAQPVVSSNTGTQSLRQVTIPQTQSQARPIARTRSSR